MKNFQKNLGVSFSGAKTYTTVDQNLILKKAQRLSLQKLAMNMFLVAYLLTYGRSSRF